MNPAIIVIATVLFLIVPVGIIVEYYASDRAADRAERKSCLACREHIDVVLCDPPHLCWDHYKHWQRIHRLETLLFDDVPEDTDGRRFLDRVWR